MNAVRGKGYGVVIPERERLLFLMLSVLHSMVKPAEDSGIQKISGVNTQKTKRKPMLIFIFLIREGIIVYGGDLRTAERKSEVPGIQQ